MNKEAPDFDKDEEVEESVITQIRSRRDAGRKKYGVSMERDDLSLRQWLQHALEEALDFSIYIQKVIKLLDKHGDLISVLDEHSRLAAEVRNLLHNGGAGPNLSRLKKSDVILRKIAGLPEEV